MNGFTLQLHAATESRSFTEVRCFVGEDSSGNFGILAGHERFMTSLLFGLARFQVAGGPWQFLALPGGLLEFSANSMCICTRHFLLDSDYARISAALDEQLLAGEERLHDLKQSLRQMEEEMLRRMWQMRRIGGAP